MFSRVAIVNRGEAAMRLIHAVRELAAESGERIETVALYTDVDKSAPFVREADLAYNLGTSVLGAALAFGSHGLAGLFQRLRGRDAAVSDSARRIGAEIDAVAEAAAAAPTPDDVAATDRDSR